MTTVTKDIALVMQQITKSYYTPQRLTFFTTASYNTFSIAGMGAGVFYKNIRAYFKHLWNRDLKTNVHEFGVNIMF